MSKRVDSDQILAGARRALAAHGPQGATLEEIAAQAGVSRVTLYRRGSNRRSILAELADQAAEEYRRALWPALTGRGRALERLEDALNALCEVAEANLPVLLSLDADDNTIFHETPSDNSKTLATRATFTDPLERICSDGHADGSIDEGNALEQATVLFNIVGGTYTHLRSSHHWSPERAQAVVVKVALHGVSAR